MNVIRTEIPDVLVIEPTVHRDPRGYFLETWHAGRYAEAGLPSAWAQDNVSRSTKGVLRGLHIQNPRPQGKLVTVLYGTVWDVAVDIRRGSPTFGRWTAAELGGDTLRQFWVPAGCAHGFVVLSDDVIFGYKCTDRYDRDAEFGVRWDDPDIGIEWPVSAPLLSEKDAALPALRDIDPERLVPFGSGSADR